MKRQAEKIIILGTGGNCVDILEALLDINSGSSDPIYNILGFLDDDAEKQKKTFDGFPVLGGLAKAQELSDALFINGIGSVSNFGKKKQILDSMGIGLGRFHTLIHPTSYVSRSSKIGNGTVLLPQVTVASHVVVGNHVIVLPQSSLSHDVVVGDYATITGGVNIAGRVKVGELAYLGTGSSIRGGVKIGARALVGMGSVVLEDVLDDTVVVGIPAKKLKATN